MVSFELRACVELGLVGTETFMDCTIRLEDGARGLLEEEIEEIHHSDEGLSEEDIIDFNLNAKVPEERMIFGTLDEAKLAWLRSSVKKMNLAFETIKKLEQVLMKNNDDRDVQVVVGNAGAKKKMNIKIQKMKDPLKVIIKGRPRGRFKTAYEKQVDKVKKRKVMAATAISEEGENKDENKSGSPVRSASRWTSAAAEGDLGGWKQVRIFFLMRNGNTFAVLHDFEKLVIDVDDPIEIDNDDWGASLSLGSQSVRMSQGQSSSQHVFPNYTSKQSCRQGIYFVSSHLLSIEHDYVIVWTKMVSLLGLCWP
ncbi:hypothetical protein Scep_018914 [Stephania cephalantha]|uniref:Uncharacterized protein n=1 Tax=Stephania cephalantha TaxID=152367 RepID=A0AAP0I9Y7_9MAGN